jgi:hypothetical protein
LVTTGDGEEMLPPCYGGSGGGTADGPAVRGVRAYGGVAGADSRHLG